MKKAQMIQQFLATQSGPIPMWGFVFNLLLAAILSFILVRIYVKYGASLSNRRMFSKNFIPVAMTTMLIITIVKASLALSLGLVGALSIVRFRTAIKEPEELAYLFLSIAIGVGLGAGQREITAIGFAGICGIIILSKRYQKSEISQNLYLTVTSHDPQKIALEQIVETLKKYCSAVDIKRFDETKEILEASFLIEFDNFEQLQTAKSELRKLNDSIKITFLDNRGII